MDAKETKTLTTMEVGLIVGLPVVLLLALAGFALLGKTSGETGAGVAQPPTAERTGGAACATPLTAPLEVLGPRVTEIKPVEAVTESALPVAVIVTFDEPIQAKPINASTFRLVGSGDGREVVIKPAAVRLISPTQARVELAGAKLPKGTYRVLLVGEAARSLTSSSAPGESSTSSSSTSSSSTATSSGMGS